MSRRSVTGLRAAPQYAAGRGTTLTHHGVIGTATQTGSGPTVGPLRAHLNRNQRNSNGSKCTVATPANRTQGPEILAQIGVTLRFFSDLGGYFESRWGRTYPAVTLGYPCSRSSKSHSREREPRWLAQRPKAAPDRANPVIQSRPYMTVRAV